MDERGSVLPAIAVVALGGVLFLGIGIDVARWGALWRDAAFAADVGATAGAAVIERSAALEGHLVLDVDQAAAITEEAALAVRPREGRSVVARARPDEVCVTVSQPFSPTITRAVGAGPRTATVTACARPAQG